MWTRRGGRAPPSAVDWPAALIVLLLALAALNACAGRIGPTVSTKDFFTGDTSADPVWQAFSHDQGTLYPGPELLAATTADTDAACATQCSTTAGCSWWSFCPPEGFDYCKLLHYCNATAGGASSEYLPTGTCLLSGMGAGVDTSVLVASNVMTGGSVGWVGGCSKTNATGSAGSRRRRALAAAATGAQQAGARLARTMRAGGQLNVTALQQARQDGSAPNPSPTPGSEGCAAGQMMCGDGCIDVESDPLNCAYCSRMCDAGESGSSGVAAAAQDPSHCGSCAYACSDGQSCSYDSCM
ncbi:hypothetical protein ABPG75_004020 [Micractinium tetrahymenae]